MSAVSQPHGWAPSQRRETGPVPRAAAGGDGSVTFVAFGLGLFYADFIARGGVG